jgi:RNA polymerase primary sigma factor
MMNKQDNVVSSYLKDVNRIRILTREEEVDLATKAAAGDKVARNKLVQANLRFVISVAKKYQNHGLELEDLISEGNIGILTAIDHFDVEKGFHFISYAVWWIRQSVLKAICEKSRMIRLPLNRANELVKIDRAREMVAGNSNERREIEEVAKLAGMTEEHVQEMLAISREMVSLDAARSDDKNAAMVGDFVVDDRNATPDNALLHKMMRDDIDDVLETLSKKEALVLRFRYGLTGFKPMSLKEVGEEFNLTKERIRQIEKKALKRLQHPYRIAKLQGYYVA